MLNSELCNHLLTLTRDEFDTWLLKKNFVMNRKNLHSVYLQSILLYQNLKSNGR